MTISFDIGSPLSELNFDLYLDRNGFWNLISIKYGSYIIEIDGKMNAKDNVKEYNYSEYLEYNIIQEKENVIDSFEVLIKEDLEFRKISAVNDNEDSDDSEDDGGSGYDVGNFIIHAPSYFEVEF